MTSGRINIHPARYAKSYLDWLGEKRDWCISRQLWWGHRIPIWHCGTCTESDLEKAFAGRSDVVWRAGESGGWLLCGETDLRGDELGPGHALTQDPDVLDTWFSSALWPHSTLGWPEETAELKKFYPTSVLSTARDIITLWVARMVIFGLFNRERRAVPRRLYPPDHPGWQRPADVEVGRQRRRPGRHHRDLRRRCPAVHARRRCDRNAGPADPGRAAQASRRPGDQHVRAVRTRPQLRQQVLERRAARADEPRGLRRRPRSTRDRWRSRIAGFSTDWTARSRK